MFHSGEYVYDICYHLCWFYRLGMLYLRWALKKYSTTRVGGPRFDTVHLLHISNINTKPLLAAPGVLEDLDALLKAALLSRGTGRRELVDTDFGLMLRSLMKAFQTNVCLAHNAQII